MAYLGLPTKAPTIDLAATVYVIRIRKSQAVATCLDPYFSAKTDISSGFLRVLIILSTQNVSAAEIRLITAQSSKSRLNPQAATTGAPMKGPRRKPAWNI